MHTAAHYFRCLALAALVISQTLVSSQALGQADRDTPEQEAENVARLHRMLEGYYSNQQEPGATKPAAAESEPAPAAADNPESQPISSDYVLLDGSRGSDALAEITQRLADTAIAESVRDTALIWITHLVSATPIPQALSHKDIIIFNFQNHTFGTFYVFQRYNVDPATGQLTVQKEDDLGPDFELQTYWERRFTPMTVSRISKLVAIKPGPTTPPPRVASPLEKMSPAERDKVRQEYFEQMVRRLP